MQNARQAFWGIFTALVSIALTLGALLLSMTEGNLHTPASTLLPTSTLLPSIPPVRQSSTPLPDTATPLLLIQTPTPLLPTQTPTPTLTLTLTPSLTNCPPPQGWLPYTVKAGDTLNGLALLYKETSVEISQANCLGTNDLLPGMIIYLPPVPTRTPVPCGAPKSWVLYIVRQGDTLYRLSQAYGVTVTDLEKANCLTGSLIQIGQSLYVPPWSPIYPSPTYPPFSTFDQTLVTPASTDTPAVIATTAATGP